jgi:hypothetical protein
MIIDTNIFKKKKFFHRHIKNETTKRSLIYASALAIGTFSQTPKNNQKKKKNALQSNQHRLITHPRRNTSPQRWMENKHKHTLNKKTFQN